MFLRNKLEEVAIHQKVKAKLEELHVDFLTLARMAHIHQYGTDPDQTQTYLNWVQHGIVPPYVANFIKE